VGSDQQPIPLAAPEEQAMHGKGAMRNSVDIAASSTAAT